MSETPVPPPVALALIVCDSVYREPATGKYTLLGTFSAIGGKDFPLVHDRLWIYVALTDGRGPTELSLRIVDVEEEREPVAHATFRIVLQDPRAVAEVTCELKKLRFTAPGEYRVQLFSGQDPLMERRLLLRQVADARPR